MKPGVRSQESGVRTLGILIFLLFIVQCSLFIIPAFSQQPATQSQPTVRLNVKYLQGVGIGYAPTAGSALTLNLASGTAFCSAAIADYAGGTLAMSDNTTNYVYLNTASSCVPAKNTTGFTSATIPIATVVTLSGAITTITDQRTMFNYAAGTGITSLGSLTAASQTFAIGTTGTAPNFASATSTHTLHIPMAATTSVTAGLISKTEYDTFNAKLGAAITSLGSLTAAAQTFAIGTTGTAPNFASATSTHTLHIPMAATATVTAGLISKTQYDAFDAKQAALSFPLTSTQGGTGNGFTKFTGPTTSERVFTLPDVAAATVLTTNAAVTPAQGGTGAAPTNDDYIPVADSNVAVTWRAMPDCTDAVGRHINYTAGTNSFSCGTSGAAGAWNSITAASGALTLANTSWATTFTQTSAVAWSWNNITAATSGVAQSSPIFNFGGRTWHAGADTADNWAVQNIVTNGTDGASTLTFTHTGSTGAATVSAPGFVSTGANAGFADFVQGAAQTATANSVGFQAPVSVTSAFHFTLPGAPAVGLLHATNATPSVLSVSAVVTGDITDGTITSADVAAPLKTDTKSFWIDTPVVADSGRIQFMFDSAVTITRVACSTKLATSTVDLNMEERAAATPDTAGTDVLSAELVCDTNQQTSCAAGCDVNTITNAGIAARVPVAITPSAIANAPTDLRIFVEYTVDP